MFLIRDHLSCLENAHVAVNSKLEKALNRTFKTSTLRFPELRQIFKSLTQKSTCWKVSHQVFIICSKYFAIWFIYKPPVWWYSKLETRLGLVVFLILSINLPRRAPGCLFTCQLNKMATLCWKIRIFDLTLPARICKKILLDECYPLFVECLQ